MEILFFIPFLCFKVIQAEGITTQSVKKMQSFKAASTNPEFYSHSSFYFRGDDSDQNQTHFTDLGELEQSAAAFPHDDAVVLSPTCGRICCRACPPVANTFCYCPSIKYSAVCQIYALCQVYSEEDIGKTGSYCDGYCDGFWNSKGRFSPYFFFSV